MTTQTLQPQRRSKKKWLLLLVPVLLLAGAAAVYSYFFTSTEEQAKFTSVPVKQGEFVISLKLKEGELEAVKAEQIVSPRVYGDLKITQLWPEGEKVEVGDLVIQFDPADFLKRVTETTQALEAAKAELEKTKANQQVEISRMKSEIENQEASLRLAQLQVEKMQFEASIKKEETKLQARQAELALAQSRKKLAAQEIVQVADLKKRELEVTQKERDLERAKKDLESLSVRAEKPGIVVYQKIWKSGRTEKVRVGDQPWGGQSLITLPDLTRMQVKTMVNEVDVDKLKMGQKALIKLDALPEPVFHGAITSIATLGREKEGEKNVKVFDVILAIEEEDTRLKPGMSTTCEVIVETVPPPEPETPGEVSSEPLAETRPGDLPLYIPLDAVFEKDGQTVVYRLKDGKPEERPVKLGKKNDDYVIVEEGLGPEDRIALQNPTLASPTTTGAAGQEKPQEQAVSIQ